MILLKAYISLRTRAAGRRNSPAVATVKISIDNGRLDRIRSMERQLPNFTDGPGSSLAS
jgi:hypothetical protein